MHQEDDCLSDQEKERARRETTVDFVRSYNARSFAYPKATAAKSAKNMQAFAEDKLVAKTFNEMRCELPGAPRSTFLMVFSADGTMIASTHGNHHIYVSDVRTGKNVKTLIGHPRTPWCIAFHPTSNQIIASGCLGGQVRIWDLSGGSEVWSSENSTVIASLAFHPEDRLLVIATYNYLHFWDWSKPEPFASTTTATTKEKVRYVAFDPLGQKLITGISNNTTAQSRWERAQAQRTNAAPPIPPPIPARGSSTGGLNTLPADSGASRPRASTTINRIPGYHVAAPPPPPLPPLRVRDEMPAERFDQISQQRVNYVSCPPRRPGTMGVMVRGHGAVAGLSPEDGPIQPSESRPVGREPLSSVPARERRITACYRTLVREYEQLVHRYLQISRPPVMIDRGTDPMDIDGQNRTSTLENPLPSTSGTQNSANSPPDIRAVCEFSTNRNADVLSPLRNSTRESERTVPTSEPPLFRPLSMRFLSPEREPLPPELEAVSLSSNMTQPLERTELYIPRNLRGVHTQTTEPAEPTQHANETDSERYASSDNESSDVMNYFNLRRRHSEDNSHSNSLPSTSGTRKFMHKRAEERDAIFGKPSTSQPSTSADSGRRDSPVETSTSDGTKRASSKKNKQPSVMVKIRCRMNQSINPDTAAPAEVESNSSETAPNNNITNMLKSVERALSSFKNNLDDTDTTASTSTNTAAQEVKSPVLKTYNRFSQSNSATCNDISCPISNTSVANAAESEPTESINLQAPGSTDDTTTNDNSNQNQVNDLITNLTILSSMAVKLRSVAERLKQYKDNPNQTETPATTELTESLNSVAGPSSENKRECLADSDSDAEPTNNQIASTSTSNLTDSKTPDVTADIKLARRMVDKIVKIMNTFSPSSLTVDNTASTSAGAPNSNNDCRKRRYSLFKSNKSSRKPILDSSSDSSSSSCGESPKKRFCTNAEPQSTTSPSPAPIANLESTADSSVTRDENANHAVLNTNPITDDATAASTSDFTERRPWNYNRELELLVTDLLHDNMDSNSGQGDSVAPSVADNSTQTLCSVCGSMTGDGTGACTASTCQSSLPPLSASPPTAERYGVPKRRRRFFCHRLSAFYPTRVQSRTRPRTRPNFSPFARSNSLGAYRDSNNFALDELINFSQRSNETERAETDDILVPADLEPAEAPEPPPEAPPPPPPPPLPTDVPSPLLLTMPPTTIPPYHPFDPPPELDTINPEHIGIGNMYSSIVQELESSLSDIRNVRSQRRLGETSDMLGNFSERLESIMTQSHAILRNLSTSIDMVPVPPATENVPVDSVAGASSSNASSPRAGGSGGPWSLSYPRDDVDSSNTSLDANRNAAGNTSSVSTDHTYPRSTHNMTPLMASLHLTVSHIWRQARLLRTQMDSIERIDRAMLELAQLRVMRQMFADLSRYFSVSGMNGNTSPNRDDDVRPGHGRAEDQPSGSATDAGPSNNPPRNGTGGGGGGGLSSVRKMMAGTRISEPSSAPRPPSAPDSSNAPLYIATAPGPSTHQYNATIGGGGGAASGGSSASAGGGAPRARKVYPCVFFMQHHHHRQRRGSGSGGGGGSGGTSLPTRRGISRARYPGGRRMLHRQLSGSGSVGGGGGSGSSLDTTIGRGQHYLNLFNPDTLPALSHRLELYLMEHGRHVGRRVDPPPPTASSGGASSPTPSTEMGERLLTMRLNNCRMRMHRLFGGRTHYATTGNGTGTGTGAPDACVTRDGAGRFNARHTLCVMLDTLSRFMDVYGSGFVQISISFRTYLREAIDLSRLLSEVLLLQIVDAIPPPTGMMLDPERENLSSRIYDMCSRMIVTRLSGQSQQLTRNLRRMRLNVRYWTLSRSHRTPICSSYERLPPPPSTPPTTDRTSLTPPGTPPPPPPPLASYSIAADSPTLDFYPAHEHQAVYSSSPTAPPPPPQSPPPPPPPPPPPTMHTARLERAYESFSNFMRRRIGRQMPVGLHPDDPRMYIPRPGDLDPEPMIPELRTQRPRLSAQSSFAVYRRSGLTAARTSTPQPSTPLPNRSRLRSRSIVFYPSGPDVSYASSSSSSSNNSAASNDPLDSSLPDERHYSPLGPADPPDWWDSHRSTPLPRLQMLFDSYDGGGNRLRRSRDTTMLRAGNVNIYTASGASLLHRNGPMWSVPEVQLNNIPLTDRDLDQPPPPPQQPPSSSSTSSSSAAGPPLSPWHPRVRFMANRERLDERLNELRTNPFFSRPRILHPLYAWGSINPFDEAGELDDPQRGDRVYESDIIAAVTPNHRIQMWEFNKTGIIPNITNPLKNVVVNECKIHNDASIDVASDGSVLVTLLPSNSYLNITNRLGIYSLEWETLGQCLYITTFDQNAVSVSLSPLSRHLVVGLASRRVSIMPSEQWTLARIFLLDGKRMAFGRLSLMKEIEQSRDTNFVMSVNCIRWLPTSGQGLVFATNTGQLRILN